MLTCRLMIGFPDLLNSENVCKFDGLFPFIKAIIHTILRLAAVVLKEALQYEAVSRFMICIQKAALSLEMKFSPLMAFRYTLQ